MIVKPSISFLNDDSDPWLIKDFNRILAAMIGNVSYPKAAALLLLVQTALAKFVAALAATGGGGEALTLAKNNARDALCVLGRSLANDVTEECNGDLTILMDSGFPIQKPLRFPIGPLTTPVAPTLALGQYSGDLNMSTTPVYGAVTYNWQVALASAPTVILQSVESTGANASFSGLTPGLLHVVTANAVGTAGTTDWSQPTTQMMV
jgi:hypothetical protein